METNTKSAKEIKSIKVAYLVIDDGIRDRKNWMSAIEIEAEAFRLFPISRHPNGRDTQQEYRHGYILGIQFMQLKNWESQKNEEVLKNP